MWAVLWILWADNKETRCPEEMNFAWATDPIEKLDKVYIYHNAGVTPDSIKHKDKFHKLFYKSKIEYVNNLKTPFEDDHSKWSRDFASAYYVDHIAAIQVTQIQNILDQLKR
jgi:hypothetical protein